MTTRFFRAAILLVSLATLTPTLYSQQALSSDETLSSTLGGGLCGNDVWKLTAEDGRRAVEQTRLNNPALYRQMAAQAKSAGHASLATVGESRSFYVYNRETGMMDYIPATLKYQGIRAKIWVDDSITSRVSATKLAQLAKGLDTATAAGSRNVNKGVIENDIEVFGNPPTPTNDDNYIHFFITDIKDGLTGGAYIAGYFSPYDQEDPATNYGSNGVNMLYIDIQGVGSIPGLLSTMAHEFQHNIHYNTNPNSETFFNEGCSEEASILCGYATRKNVGYRGNTNVNLFRWTDASQDPTGAQILTDYERAMTFTHYMREQFGEEFLTALNLTRKTGMTRIDSALKRIGVNRTWRDVLKGFAITNYVVKDYIDSNYIYQQPILATYNSSSATVTGFPSASILGNDSAANYTGANYPASGQLSLNPYAIGYLVYNAPAGGGLRSTFSWSGSDAAVFAILYRNKTVVDVRELPSGSSVDLVEWPVYTKVVYVLVNLKASRSSATVVSWTQQQLVAGVEAPVAAARTLSISSIAPNPARESATVEFAAPRSGDVDLEVFDALGASVLRRTVAAEAGQARATIETASLPVGAYIVQMRQGETRVARALVVTH